MQCIKCKKAIPDNSLYCSFCGKKQTATKAKYHKRESGTGTIVKDTRYKKQWLAYAPMYGHQKTRKYLGCYVTRAEAAAAIEEFIKNGRPDLYNATLAEIRERWKAAHYPTVSRSAERLYNSLWKRFAEIENIKMTELRTEHFQTVINTATSKSAADTLKVMAQMICEYAIKNDIITKNYADYVIKPKFEKKEKKVFSDADIAALWKYSDDEKVQAVLLMIYTGFRIGEIVAIKKEDIHLDEGYIIGGEKTEAGKNRIVPLPPNIPELADFIRARTNTDSDKLYNCSSDYFRQFIFYPALLTAGLAEQKDGKIISDFTPHCTRHTFASISAAAGMNPQNLQKIIGHANFSTTADVYIHQDISTLKEEMRKITK